MGRWIKTHGNQDHISKIGPQINIQINIIGIIISQ